MSRPTHRKVRPDESLLQFAHYLMDHYGEGIKEFRTLLTPGDCKYQPDEGPLIVWRVPEGLEVLLHEIGHHRLKHWEAFVSRAEEIIGEAEAWLWAERRSRLHGIKFNYEQADKLFSNYLWRGRNRGPVKIDWRYRK